VSHEDNIKTWKLIEYKANSALPLIQNFCGPDMQFARRPEAIASEWVTISVPVVLGNSKWSCHKGTNSMCGARGLSYTVVAEVSEDVFGSHGDEVAQMDQEAKRRKPYVFSAGLVRQPGARNADEGHRPPG
jgi:hypothetical protein